MEELPRSSLYKLCNVSTAISPLCYCVLTGGPSPPQHTGQSLQPLADSADQLLVFQHAHLKPVMRSAVKQRLVHTGWTSSGFYCLSWFCPCVRGLREILRICKDTRDARLCFPEPPAVSCTGAWGATQKFLFASQGLLESCGPLKQ